MCRWLAFAGSPLRLDALLFRPEHSFIRQSEHAWKSTVAVNGDGVGVGWYGADATPGLYRETRPAWNDDNLLSIAQHVRSRMFLAHVRATSGSAIQRSNCHPFRHGRWLFQHNGEIEGFERMKRELDLAVDPALYPHMQGSGDSERMFYLALSSGLERDPPAALARMAGSIEALAERHAIAAPLVMTLALTDGERLFAVRYSSEGDAPSLYHSDHLSALRECDGRAEPVPPDGVIVLSEPLDEVSEHWVEVPQSTLLVVEGGEVRVRDFVPLR